MSVSTVLSGLTMLHLGAEHGTFARKAHAQAAVAQAKQQLKLTAPRMVTVRAFQAQWTTDPLFQRPKRATNLHNAERTSAFVNGRWAKRGDKRVCVQPGYGTLLMTHVGDEHVAEWLAGGRNQSTVPALRAMFNDALTAKAGRVVTVNPFARLGLAKARGNRDTPPPPESMVWELIASARAQAGPSLAAWLQVACYTGMRPGELDALRWANVDLPGGWIHVTEQYSAKAAEFTLPKNGRERRAILTPPARQALLSVPQTGEFCFTQLRGGHWTASSRAYHWKAVRAQTGYTGTLYLATRHFAGWYMRNVLRMDSEDVAVALGHRDGGELVRTLYGHLEDDAALERVRAAYEDAPPTRRLRAVNGPATHASTHGGPDAAS